MTFGIRMLSIMTLSIMTFSIMTFSITTFSITTFSTTTFSIMTLSITTFSIINDTWHHKKWTLRIEWRYAECRWLNVVIECRLNAVSFMLRVAFALLCFESRSAL